MAETAARKRAHNTYIARFARIEIRTTTGQRDAIQAHAAASGESVNGFIGRAIQETMERDKAAPDDSQGKKKAGD